MKNWILRLDTATVHAFKGVGEREIACDDSTYIVGRNGAGKSTMLEAIVWALTGFGLDGKKLNPFPCGGASTSWVKLDGVVNGEEMTIRRIQAVKPGGKTETTLNVKLDIDKELFLALSNPRYMLGQSPKDAKNLIAKCVRMPVGYLELDMEEDVVEAAIDIDGDDSMEKLNNVELEIKKLTNAIKTLEELNLMAVGRKDGMESLIKMLGENSVSEILRGKVSESLMEIAKNTLVIDEKKAISKKLNEYRTAACEVLCQKLNEHLNHCKVVVTENGKDVFNITYDGKDVRSCSNSEQLLAGLEMVDSLSELSDCSFPVIIDNAECLQSLSWDDYPNIGQIIAAFVADEELSVWDGEDFNELHNIELMPRSEVPAQPIVQILEGWGKK